MDKIKMLKKIQLGKYFRAWEFCNKEDDHDIIAPNLDLFVKLDALREIVGQINITSGYRTPQYNAKIGGSSNSNHIRGLAVDIKFNFEPWDTETLKMICSGLGFVNIGIYKVNQQLSWLHLDIGEKWNAKNGWYHYRDSAIKEYFY